MAPHGADLGHQRRDGQPSARRPNLYFRLLADDTNVHGEDTVAFLAQLRGEIKGPMTVLWDQSRIHERSSVVKAYLPVTRRSLPRSSPALPRRRTPTRGLWGDTKYHRLPNDAPEDTGVLRSRLCTERSALCGRPDLLASFIRHAGIPLRMWSESKTDKLQS